MEHESAQAHIRLGLIGGFVLLLCVCALVIIAAFSSMGAERLVGPAFVLLGLWFIAAQVFGLPL